MEEVEDNKKIWNGKRSRKNKKRLRDVRVGNMKLKREKRVKVVRGQKNIENRG